MLEAGLQVPGAWASRAAPANWTCSLHWSFDPSDSIWTGKGCPLPISVWGTWQERRGVLEVSATFNPSTDEQLVSSCIEAGKSYGPARPGPPSRISHSRCKRHRSRVLGCCWGYRASLAGQEGGNTEPTRWGQDCTWSRGQVAEELLGTTEPRMVAKRKLSQNRTRTWAG